MFKVSPDGVPYGSLIQPSDVQCQSYESDLALILLQSGNTESVHADRPVGVCSVWDNQFDWAIVGPGGGPGTSPPQFVPDPSSAPDDGNAPEEVDVATLTEPSSEPAGARTTSRPRRCREQTRSTSSFRRTARRH